MAQISFSSTPNLVLRLPMWRSRLVLFLMFVGFVALVIRAMWVQGFGNSFYEEKGNKATLRSIEMPASRGKILDRNGEVLATSLLAKAIIAFPDAIPDDLPKEKVSELAKLLEMPEAEVRKRMRSERNQVFLKRQVDLEVAKQIRQLGIPGIAQNNEYRRLYPEGEAMAHIVGFTNVEDKGQEGMELAREKDLVGQPGRRRVIQDRLGRYVENLGIISPPRDGADLQLSIDSKVQFLAYNEIKAVAEKHNAKGAGAVVLDVHTGEILALANYPSYNPNSRQNLSGEQLRNRVLTDTFEPGSTMKPFPISLALEKGLVQPNTQMAIGKSLVVGKKAITDTHPYGSLTVAEVVQKSSNIGTVKMAMQLEAQEMWELFQALGFGQAPEIGFPGAVAGRLRPYKNWVPIDQATMSYGYGLSASLFQVARAYSIFARDGELVSTTIYKTDQSPKGVRVISAKTAIQMREMLEMVTQTGGTATGAQTMGYRVGGKTGTAHKVEGKGYAGNKYRGFFVGMAPMSAPRIVVAVMVDEPRSGGYYGGIVAAPAFSNIVAGTLRNMNVLPDAAIKQMVDQEFKSQNIKPAALTGGNNKVATTQ
ncbi:penicillin-binding protein 2 [Polynucleobacter sp. MWH-Loch1C5]|jgi:cell division protein FtsI (penicillin-binding protein 3)|uniref:peptidoglycan D,D-transpeptidase FtsI family protein n=1 Tax=Polynucleobacter sp. MWH-Loch1C5 TaxID=2689108 RepID=UPI001C0D855D|nr:penicillin-binding protein 2 [Polynucleobacter sp. MWH-Loch1C5]MBU3542302.1 penicillin-binding protein 2 [Polynucleobacter sp. MWH-Loch1C5]